MVMKMEMMMKIKAEMMIGMRMEMIPKMGCKIVTRYAEIIKIQVYSKWLQDPNCQYIIINHSQATETAQDLSARSADDDDGEDKKAREKERERTFLYSQIIAYTGVSEDDP